MSGTEDKLRKNDGIDAVLTWVDGNDPVLRRERARYLTDKGEDKLEDIAGRERFIQSNEIRFAVASILRFAPYVGRIFIITNRQTPDLDAFLAKNFPDNKVSISVVDQNTLFEGGGYGKYLPVFNSIAVETMMWRIPGLSEEFIYMNDDFFFAAPSKKEDLFRDGKVVCYSNRFPSAVMKVLRRIRRSKNGHKRFTYKDSLLNGAEIIGWPHFYYLPHEPHPILKSVLEKFFTEHPECVERNVRHRFRDSEQFNVQGFFYVLSEKQGRLIHVPRHNVNLMIRKLKNLEYLQKKLDWADSQKDLKFGCMNALQDADPQEKELFEKWISSRLGVTSDL